MPTLKIQGIKGEKEITVDFSEKKKLGSIIYFYPKDNTSGCTTEGLEFNELLSEFKKLGYEIYGVSRDSLKSHSGFICKQGFEFTLLSDKDELLCKALDVIQPKNMYGKMVVGIERSTFIIDSSGKVQAAFRKVKAAGHAAMILEFVKTNKL